MLTQSQKRIKIETVLTRWYLLLMTALLPLVIWDGYYDITEAKTGFFAVVSMVYLLGRLACWLQLREDGKLPGSPGWDGVFAMALSVIVLLSSLASGYFWVSVSGATGRWQGAAMFWIYAAVYFALRSARLRAEDVLFPLAAGLFFSSLLAIFNHLGWDPLRMHIRLVAFDRNRYISTLGNINFAGAYLTLALPVAAWFFLRTERRLRRAWLGTVCLAGFLAAMATRSDAAVLGSGAVLLLFPFFLRDDACTVRRWCLLWPALSVSAQLYRLLTLAFHARLSALMQLLLHPAISVGMSAFGLVAWLTVRRAGEETIRRRTRQYALLLAAAAVLSAAALVLLNMVFQEIPLGRWDEWLRFSDSWGTDRVRIWRRCLAIYGEFSLPQKLFGGGCGVLDRLDRVRRLFDDAVLDTAHCEYLQILLNWGALGLAAYLGWMILAFRRAWTRGGPASAAILAGLTGYAIQALVNIAQAPGICLFFVLLGAAAAEPIPPGAEREGEKNPKSD